MVIEQHTQQKIEKENKESMEIFLYFKRSQHETTKQKLQLYFFFSHFIFSFIFFHFHTTLLSFQFIFIFIIKRIQKQTKTKATSSSPFSFWSSSFSICFVCVVLCVWDKLRYACFIWFHFHFVRCFFYKMNKY